MECHTPVTGQVSVRRRSGDANHRGVFVVRQTDPAQILHSPSPLANTFAAKQTLIVHTSF
jgi:hypothetical protein